MTFKKALFVAALGAFLGFLLVGVKWLSADPGVSVGVVDLSAIEKSDYFQAKVKELNEYATEQQKLVEGRIKAISEKKDEFAKEKDELTSQLNELEKEQAKIENKIKECKEKGMDISALEERKKQLESKITEIKGKLDVLGVQIEALLKRVETIRNDLAKKIDEKKQEILQTVQKDIERVCTQIAAEKNLTVVINKAVVLCGGMDITEEVVSRLNASVK